MTKKTSIFLCDDDADVRGGLSFMLCQAGFEVCSFAGGQELLDAVEKAKKPLRAIFVLDLNMPPMDEGGIFYPLHCWLDENISKFGFFRPYKFFRGGMYPEPWHLSFAPLSMQVIKLVTPELLARVTQDAAILGKELVLDRIDLIYKDHILNFVSPDDQ